MSQDAGKYIVRFPKGWREAIKARAAQNRRSMNAEILTALEPLVKDAGAKFEGESPALTQSE